MTIFNKLNMIWHKHSEKNEFLIQTIRFKKLLENAKALLDLFEDGNEKIRGEYILDRHYVISLIDGIIEKLGMIVYDTCTLSPERGEYLYEQYYVFKLKAQAMISGGNTNEHEDARAGAMSEKIIFNDPEYRLLSDVLSWFNGEETPAVMNLMKQAFVDSIRAIEKINDLKKDSVFKDIGFNEMNHIYMVDQWKYEAPVIINPGSLDDIYSIPLKLLLLDAFNNSSRDKNKIGGEWIVAASEYEISLMNLTENFRFRLDATVSGYEESDYIFVFTDNHLDTEKILPAGFHKEKIHFGNLCWKLDVSSTTIEDSLITIGRNLFG
jgi:hypothetical protein